MKVTYLSTSISRAAGGIYEIARRTAQTLSNFDGTLVEVLGLQDEFTKDDLTEWNPLQPRFFPKRRALAYGYSPELDEALNDTTRDLLHVHGLWSYPTSAARRWSHRSRKPFVVTIHGMLEPWALRSSRWKKRVAALLFENAALRQAACLHVNSEAELASVRAYGLRNPICIIPNGIDLPVSPLATPPPWAGQVPSGSKVLLYLGRLHPKKGLANLLAAWSRLRSQRTPGTDEWQLAIAGWDQLGHEVELKAIVENLALAGSVRFLGPQFREAKAAAYHHADAFILPSHSEGLPMVVLEAWAYGLPVLMTPECILPEGFSRRAAISISTNVNGVTAGLEKLLHMDHNARTEMGILGKSLVAERFTWPGVAQQTREVYEWLIGGGSQPSCIAQN